MSIKVFVSGSSALRQFGEVVRGSAESLATATGEPIEVMGQDFKPGQEWTEETRKQIGAADLVLADVTNRNPNVLFEVGLAQALGKPAVLIGNDPSEAPWNLAHSQFVLVPSQPSPAHLVSRVSDALEAVLESWKQGESRPKRPQSLFVSYSHADREYLDRIIVHLKPLERAGLLDLWSDTRLKAGDRWREEIERAIEKCAVAILIVSADFLASEFITSNELPRLLAVAEERGARIVPVIAKPSRFVRDPRLSRFQALNDPVTPLLSMNEAERETIYAELAETVEAHFGADTATG